MFAPSAIALFYPFNKTNILGNKLRMVKQWRDIPPSMPSG
jgi:hypothetical protein